MKAKIVSCIAIGIVILVCIITSIYIILSGMKNGGYNYVMLEFNPDIEFVTDKKDKVVGYKALNEEARNVVANDVWKGEYIQDVVTKFLETSLKMGYLKTDEEEYNVIKSTVVPGLTNALDVHVYKAINKFLVDNEIMAVVVENTNDKEKYKEAKELAIGVHKLQLINSVIKSNPSLTKEQLTKKSERELIDIIMELSDKYNSNNPTNQNEIETKQLLIEQNKENYEDHVTSQTSIKRDFVKKLKELNMKEQTKYELNCSLLTED